VTAIQDWQNCSPPEALNYWTKRSLLNKHTLLCTLSLLSDYSTHMTGNVQGLDRGSLVLRFTRNQKLILE